MSPNDSAAATLLKKLQGHMGVLNESSMKAIYPHIPFSTMTPMVAAILGLYPLDMVFLEVDHLTRREFEAFY